jgi:hypothetical protein
MTDADGADAKKPMLRAGDSGYECGRSPETTALAAGVGIAVDGHDLVLEASAPPTAAVLDALSRYKADIIALLRSIPLHSNSKRSFC